MMQNLLPIFMLFCTAAMIIQETAASQCATALEDQATGSFLVATSDRNFAIYLGSQQNAMGWSTISVKQNKILVTTLDKTIESLLFSSINETGRSFIEEVYVKFSQDLAFPALLSNQRKKSRTYLPVLSAFPFNHGQLVGPKAIIQQQHQRQQNMISPPNPINLKSQLEQYKLLPMTTNYYNLQGSLLNETLAGDAYNFDLKGNILEVYSTSVSLSQRQNSHSILYRDQNYFSYSRPKMPLGINRIFLVNEYVFFIYEDGSVFVKSNWQLDYAELDLITDAKLEIKELQLRWPYQASLAVEPNYSPEIAGDYS